MVHTKVHGQGFHIIILQATYASPIQMTAPLPPWNVLLSYIAMLTVTSTNYYICSFNYPFVLCFRNFIFFLLLQLTHWILNKILNNTSKIVLIRLNAGSALLIFIVTARDCTYKILVQTDILNLSNINFNERCLEIVWTVIGFVCNFFSTKNHLNWNDLEKVIS